jgi:hypothetical protein
MTVIYRTKADFHVGIGNPTRKMTAEMVSWYTASIQAAFEHRRNPYS